MSENSERGAENLKVSASNDEPGNRLVTEAYNFMDDHKGELAALAAIAAAVIATKGKALGGLVEKEALPGAEGLAVNSTERLLRSGTSTATESSALFSRLNHHGNHHSPFALDGLGGGKAIEFFKTTEFDGAKIAKASSGLNSGRFAANPAQQLLDSPWPITPVTRRLLSEGKLSRHVYTPSRVLH